MKKTTLFLVLLVLLAGSAPALADGKFYWPEESVPEIPYQRALLLFDGGQETLVLQSKYRTVSAPAEAFLGWVVPLPSVPEVASMDPAPAGSLFRSLDHQTSPKVTRVSELLLLGALVLPPLLAILTLLACLLSFFVSGMQSVRRRRAALAAASLLLLIPSLGVWLGRLLDVWEWPGILLYFLGPASALLVLILCGLSLPIPGRRFLKRQRWILVGAALLALVNFVGFVGVYVSLLPMRKLAPQSSGVEVITEEQVGIYDVQVVRAERAEELIAWLNDNQFRYDVTDEEVFREYLERGWCFVVARVDPSRDTGERQVGSEGLVAPLILRFRSETPVYPLALTSTAGHRTEVLLYVASQNKWETDGRLDLHYARGVRLPGRGHLLEDVEPAGFFVDEDLALPYLCKLKGRLSPAQMREDLTLTLVGDEEPYRKHIFVW